MIEQILTNANAFWALYGPSILAMITNVVAVVSVITKIRAAKDEKEEILKEIRKSRDENVKLREEIKYLKEKITHVKED